MKKNYINVGEKEWWKAGGGEGRKEEEEEEEEKEEEEGYNHKYVIYFPCSPLSPPFYPPLLSFFLSPLSSPLLSPLSPLPPSSLFPSESPLDLKVKNDLRYQKIYIPKNVITGTRICTWNSLNTPFSFLFLFRIFLWYT